MKGYGYQTRAPPVVTSCLPHPGTRHLTSRLGSDRTALLLPGRAGPVLPGWRMWGCWPEKGIAVQPAPAHSPGPQVLGLLPSALPLVKVSASTLSFPSNHLSSSDCFPPSVPLPSLQASLFFMLKGESQGVGAGGLARRKRAERDRAAGEEVTSFGVQSRGRCSHSLPPNDPWTRDCPQAPPQWAS